MDFFTLAQLRRKVQIDLDLEAEDFVQLEELDGYLNEGIDEAESHIHTLGMEDEYFTKFALLPWTLGGDLFDLPSDIYANKIRGVTYDDGSLIYEIKRVRGRHLFNKIANAQHFSNSDDYYQYKLINQTAGTGSQMNIYPKSRINSTVLPLVAGQSADGLPIVKIWYIRQSNRLVLETDVCDIPEFYHFVIKFAKWMVLLKEGHPNMGAAKAELDYQRNLMIDTLSNMVPDKDSEIVPDLEMYTDIS